MKRFVLMLLCATLGVAASEGTQGTDAIQVGLKVLTCESVASEIDKAASARVSSEVQSAIYFRLGDIQMYSYQQMLAIQYWQVQMDYEQIYYSSDCGLVD